MPCRKAKLGQNATQARGYKRPASAAVGIAFAAGWNDVAAGRGYRKDYEREFGTVHSWYESGRLHAVNAKAAGIRISPWVTKFTEWAPHVMAATSTLRRMGVSSDEVFPPAFTYAE